MKVLGATILVFLCTVTLCSYPSEKGKTYIVPTCCFSYISRKIPRKLVVAYFKTSSQCSNHGVIFLTRKDRLICANPSDAWVQEYISTLKNNSQVDPKWQFGVPVEGSDSKWATSDIPSPMSTSPLP